MPALEADGTTIRNLYGTQNGSNQFSAGALLVHPTTGAPLLGPATKNNSLPVVQASDWTTELGTTAQVTLQNAVTANGDGTPATAGGYATALFAVTGGGTGTVNFEASGDNGTTWLPLLTTQMGSGLLLSSVSAATNGLYRATLAGLDLTNGLIRARISGYVSGSITVAVTLSTVVAANKVVGQAPLNLLASGTANALNGDVIAATDASLYREISIQLTGTWSATVAPQVSTDGGASWNSIVGRNTQNGQQVVNLTGNGNYAFPLQPGAQFRLRVVAYTSGTVNGSVVFSSVASVSNTLTMLAGATFPVSATQLPATLGANGGLKAEGDAAAGATDAGNPISNGLLVQSAPTLPNDGQRVKWRGTPRGAAYTAGDYRTILLDASTPNPTGNDVVVAFAGTAPQASDFQIRDASAHDFYIPIGASGWRDWTLFVRTSAVFNQNLVFQFFPAASTGAAFTIYGGTTASTITSGTGRSFTMSSIVGGTTIGASVSDLALYTFQYGSGQPYLLLRVTAGGTPSSGALELIIIRRT
jgi:hypothetical protein